MWQHLFAVATGTTISGSLGRQWRLQASAQSIFLRCLWILILMHEYRRDFSSWRYQLSSKLNIPHKMMKFVKTSFSISRSQKPIQFKAESREPLLKGTHQYS
jgi:hypothetical protein